MNTPFNIGLRLINGLPEIMERKNDVGGFKPDNKIFGKVNVR